MNISANTIVQKRKDKSTVFFLTGGTGFIGSHIASELLRRGYPVILLARPDKEKTGEERAQRLMQWLGMDEQNLSRLQIIEGHMDEPRFGMEASRYKALTEGIDEVIHCASNTSFSERKRDEIEKANVTNLQNLMHVIRESRCHFFHHISTAYVAGRRQGPCREEFVETQEFTNVYEATKYLGEKIVIDSCQKQGIRLNIYRPSIVYGNSKDGRTLRFNALYYPIRVILFFKNLYEKDIKEHGGKKAALMSVEQEIDGSIRLPIRIVVNGQGGINLIPIDFFIDVFMTLMEESLRGDIFHIISNGTTTIQTLIEYTKRYFGLSGIRTVTPDEFNGMPRNGLETIFEHYIDAYGPYIRDTRIFEHDQTQAILDRKGVRCPQMDYDIFSRCMRYAVDADWGQSLFADVGDPQ